MPYPFSHRFTKNAFLFICGITCCIHAFSQENHTPGETYAIVVGISNYKFIKPLNYADRDAELFTDLLRSTAGGGIKEENLFLLKNDSANAGNFWSSLLRICNRDLHKGDRVYIYFAGHGDAIKGLNEYYLLLSDCQPANDGNNYLLSLGAIDMYHLKNRIGTLTSREVEVILILDACRTNELAGGYASQAFNTSIIQAKVGEITMLATGPGQVSIEDISFGRGHGLFTYNLIDGLSGRADAENRGNGDKVISFSEIQDWVGKEVPRMSAKFNVAQQPVFCCEEKKETRIGIVDNQFSEAWTQFKKSDPGNQMAFMLPGKTERKNEFSADTGLLALYNKFNSARKENRLWGDHSADLYYETMQAKFPRERITEDARYALAADFINFAQQKINLYLEGKDLYSLEILREKADSSRQPEFLADEYDRMKNAVSEKWTVAGMMIEKAGRLLSAGDQSILHQLQPKINFLLARGYLSEEKENTLNWNEAIQFAKQAWVADSTAAYTAECLALLYAYRKSFNYMLRQKGLGGRTNQEIDFIGRPSDSAAHFFRKAMQLAPNWVNIFRTVAIKMYGFEKKDSAIYYLKKALAINPADAQTYIFLGELNKWNNPSISNDYFRKAIELTAQSAHANLYYRISKSFLPFETMNWRSSQPDSVIYYSEKAILSDPSFPLAYFNIASVYSSKNKLDSVLRYYKLAVRNAPGFENGYVKTGDLYLSLNQPDSAFYYFRKLFAINRDNVFATSSIARYFDRISKKDSAIYYYKKTLDLNWDREYNRERLGYLIMETNKKDSSAYAYFSANLTNGMAGWRDHLNMACYFAAMGDVERSTQYLENAFKKGLTNKSLVYGNRWLASIRNSELFISLMAKYFP